MTANRPVRALHAFLAAAALGLAVNVLVFGLGHLLGTSAYWDFPEADSQSNLVGYRYFLHEPWHWPLFESRTMNVPYLKSIAVTDSIPPFALLNKAVASVVPPWGPFTARGYLGLWHGLVYVLQACFGVACIRALGHRTWSAVVCTSLVCLAIPAFINRYSHVSLEAHFFLLWALSLYLRSPRGADGPRALRVWQLVELGLAAMVNPYHLAMSSGLFAASLVRSRQPRTIGIWLPAGGAVVTLGLWFAGFLSSETRRPMPGFESASTNLLSPFVPIRSALLGDRRALADVFAAPYQYEGYAYLGLGLLVVLALFVPHARSLGDVVKRHAPLFAVALLAWLFALSNHVYFGSHRLVAFGLPHVLDPIVGTFRAPGRFVWLPMYVLIVFLLHWALRHFTVGWRRFVVPAIAVLQIVDGGLGDWKQRREMTRGPFRHYLDLAAWSELVAAHDAVDVEPPYECGSGQMIDESVAREVHFITSMRGVPINGVKSARPSRDCAIDAQRLATLVPSARTLTVLLPQVVENVPRLEGSGETCGTFYGCAACSSLEPAIAEAVRRGALRGKAAPVLALGAPLSFALATNAQFFGPGWYPALPEGRWTTGDVSTLVFRLDGALPVRARLTIEATAQLCGDRHVQDVDVHLAGVLLGTLHYDAQSNDAQAARSLDILEPDCLRGEVCELELRPRDRRTMREAHCSDDAIALGLLVRRVSVE
jgi:Family of unknown function (DUF6311)